MRRLHLPIAIICVLLVAQPPRVYGGNATFLSDTAIAALTDADRKMQLETALSVLESADANASKEWSNPETGSSGRSESLGNYKSDDGLQCRKLKLFTRAKGIESQFAFPACKNASGEWFIASGKRLTKT